MSSDTKRVAQSATLVLLAMFIFIVGWAVGLRMGSQDRGDSATTDAMSYQLGQDMGELAYEGPQPAVLLSAVDAAQKHGLALCKDRAHSGVLDEGTDAVTSPEQWQKGCEDAVRESAHYDRQSIYTNPPTPDEIWCAKVDLGSLSGLKQVSQWVDKCGGLRG